MLLHNKQEFILSKATEELLRGLATEILKIQCQAKTSVAIKTRGIK